jgi:hypothetical protein
MKHVGKMKNNSARVVVAYRTIPGDPNSCLIVGVQGLGDSYHDTLMTVVESDSGQQANELADILASRRFPDGSVMLGYLHANGHLRKMPTNTVLMTPDTQTTIPLDQLNQIIADQKGVSIDDLAVNDGSEESQADAKNGTTKKTSTKVAVSEAIVDDEPSSATEMRSKADSLFKEAARLRKLADELDPPKSKITKSKSKAIAE